MDDTLKFRMRRRAPQGPPLAATLHFSAQREIDDRDRHFTGPAPTKDATCRLGRSIDLYGRTRNANVVTLGR